MVNVVRDLILTAGKTIVLIGALISFLLAIGYLFFPEMIKAASKVANQLFSADEWLYVNRIVVGIVFAAATVLLFMVLALVR